MNRTTCMKHAKRLALGLAALALAATPSFAQTTYDLCATTGSVTIGAANIPIWGYVAGDCTTPTIATLPGPVLRATAGETLTINLYTDLTVPVSFFAPGLRASTATGSPGMFTAEAGVGTPASYTFANIKAGTYLYHSGTDITTQVPMGLYGALVVDVAAGQAYGDVTYAQDEVLVYSEIDPSLNDGTYTGGARVVNWNPQYFLINGKAYAPANPPIAVNTSQRTLLRFVNAGLQTFVPTLDGGLYMDLVAEDGNRYPQPFTQYGIELPAGKTIDAIVSPGTDGTYALYDRALHLTNGGLLTHLEAAAAAAAPTALNDGPYTVVEDTPSVALTVPAPGVLGNDTFSAPATGLTAVLVTTTSNGTLALADDGSFTYTPDADFAGTDTFTYLANDGTLDSNVATVTFDVTAVDDDPVATPDAYDEEEGVILSVPAPGVLANDVDVDGDPLTAVYVSGPVVTFDPDTSATGPGVLTLNTDGSFTHDPTGTGLNAGDQVTFVYDACDAAPPCSTATVTITVTPVNVAPTAVDDGPYVTDENVPLSVAAPGVLSNDSDPNFDPLTAVQVTGPTNGSLTLNADGSFTYTPNGDFNGADSFTYVANDGLLDSNVATVTITVNLVNDPPFAADDFAAVARNSRAGDPANTFSVTANDVDPDGTIAVSTVDLNPLVAGYQTSVTTSRGGTATVDSLGNVTFVPKRGFRGTDTFTYTVNDNLGATSNVATVRVNVL